MLMQVM